VFGCSPFCVILSRGASSEVPLPVRGALRGPAGVPEVQPANRQPSREPHVRPTNDISGMSAPTSEPPNRANEVCPSVILQCHELPALVKGSTILSLDNPSAMQLEPTLLSDAKLVADTPSPLGLEPAQAAQAREACYSTWLW